MESPAKPVISVIGTTGVGKSELAVCIAEAFGGEIINTDSMQMYKGLPQITNKHPIPERHGIPHHIMNHVDWSQEYDIHTFQRECLAKIEDIHSRGKTPILVGGTHYYLQSVLLNNKTIVAQDEETGKTVTPEQNQILEAGTSEELHKLLTKYDPVIAMKFHPHDHRRIKRALQIYYETGRPASQFYEDQRKQQVLHSRLRFNTLFLWIYSKGDPLHERLDKRVDKMMDSGALDELSQLYDYYENLPEPRPGMDQGVFQVIGYKEFLPYLTTHNLKEVTKKEVLQDPVFQQCCDKMKLRTWQYAKRQVKWIRNALIPDLETEAEHNWYHFGKVYVVDATDLGRWDTRVKDRGVNIAKEFLSKGNVSDKTPREPSELEGEKLLNAAKEKNSPDKWVYFTCDICKDNEGKPLVLVGKDQYEEHLKGRKHARSIKKLHPRRRPTTTPN